MNFNDLEISNYETNKNLDENLFNEKIKIGLEVGTFGKHGVEQNSWVGANVRDLTIITRQVFTPMRTFTLTLPEMKTMKLQQHKN